MAVMPVAVACVIDAMVCICVGSYEVLNGHQSFCVLLHTGMCAIIFMFSSSVDGIVLPHLNLVQISSCSFYTSTKFDFQ